MRPLLCHLSYAAVPGGRAGNLQGYEDCVKLAEASLGGTRVMTASHWGGTVVPPPAAGIDGELRKHGLSSATPRSRGELGNHVAARRRAGLARDVERRVGRGDRTDRVHLGGTRRVAGRRDEERGGLVQVVAASDLKGGPRLRHVLEAAAGRRGDGLDVDRLDRQEVRDRLA